MPNQNLHINLNFESHFSRKRFCFATEPRSGLAKVVVVGFSDSYVFRVFFKARSVWNFCFFEVILCDQAKKHVQWINISFQGFQFDVTDFPKVKKRYTPEV